MPLDPQLVQGFIQHENELVKKGGHLLITGPEPCEDSHRTCQDAFWAGLFLCTVGCVAFFSIRNSEEVFELAVFAAEHQSAGDVDPVEQASAFTMGILAVVTAGFVSFLGAILFLHFAKCFTTCVVWTALLVFPMILVAAGLRYGAGSLVLAFISFCIICCMRDRIPFTVLLIQTVIKVMQRHPSMMLISMLGSALSVGWFLLCAFCTLGLYVVHGKVMHFVTRLTFMWGSMVVTNACACACNGVFGRWYFGKDGDSPVRRSLKAAFVTSFGSICFGSFIVAATRALEAVVKSKRKDARRESNFVTCMIFCILECVVSMIGDIIEWFNSFAYVQCAVRGFGFIDSVRATHALCTYANIGLACRSSLVDMVVFLESLLGAAMGAFASTLVMTAVAPAQGAGAVFPKCQVMAFIVGWTATMAALQPLSSGATTFVVCWAENAQALARSQPELAQIFAERAGDRADVQLSQTALQPLQDPRNVAVWGKRKMRKSI
mmetsp:Transcript_158228/g.288448  ORF Transcript_158228/g.288448 Transcript_158228/m.288448 type:complete len:492 (+) Transcript_158228:80-1555(+)